jgi:hypothetical protein
MYIEELRAQTHTLNITQCARILELTPDELESLLWCRNFPISTTSGHGPGR